MTEKQTEALERLNQGIQESRQDAQKRTMNLARDYFGDSAEALKQQIQENRATLEGLPDQVPGGHEEAFQALFQELMDNYSTMEECINGAQENVAALDTDRIRRQGEVEATDAARRQAKELGIDLTEVEGTGADGRIILPDVLEAAEAMEDRSGGEEEPEASGNGAADQAAQGAQDAAGQATDQAGQAAQQAQDAAGQATDQAGQLAGQATDQAGQVREVFDGLAGGGQEDGGGPLEGITDQAGQATDQAGQVAGQAQGVADQAGQAAQGAQDAAGGVADQAQQAAGQATDQAGQAAQQVQETAGQAAQQGRQAAEEDEADEGPRATNAARRKAQELGVDLSEVQGTGAGGLITLKDVMDS